jgi:hypothetical protein
MSSKTGIKLKDYLSDDGKLDLSILNLKTVPNINEIVCSLSSSRVLFIAFCTLPLDGLAQSEIDRFVK